MKDNNSQDKLLADLLQQGQPYLRRYAGEYAEVNSRLSDKRLTHSLGVAATACQLAEKYGGDPAEAYLAGLCHDIAKELPPEAMQELLGQSPLAADAEIWQRSQLWHAPAGAVLLSRLQSRYPTLTPAVQQACLWHTLGRPAMSGLEKAVFVADLIEPGRDFPDLPQIRQVVWQDLDAGVCACMAGVIGFLEQQGDFVHPLAYAAWTYYKRSVE